MKLDDDLPMPQAAPTPEPVTFRPRLLCVGGPLAGRHLISSLERVAHDGGAYMREHVAGMRQYLVLYANA